MQLVAGTCYDAGMSYNMRYADLRPGMLFKRTLIGGTGGSYLCLILGDAPAGRMHEEHKRCLIIVLEGMDWWTKSRGNISTVVCSFSFAADELAAAP